MTYHFGSPVSTRFSMEASPIHQYEDVIHYNKPCR